jgi:outer membrane lipoprotein-sorting protein
MRLLTLFATATMALLVAHAAWAEEQAASAAAVAVGPPSLQKVLSKLDDLYRAGGSIGRMELKVVKPGVERTLRMKTWARGDDRSLIVIESPAREKGIATLRVGKNLWNYLPRISRTIRIPPSMMQGSWMGSDFTNDDLVKESSYTDDYASRIEGRSEEPPGWRISMEAKPGAVGLWKRIELVVTEDGSLPLEMRYYDRKGRHSRTMTYGVVREMGGRVIPTKMVMIPTRKEGHRTEVRYLDMEFNAKVPERMFNLSSLERGR